ncbi:MAG: hypothetical protein A2Y86_06990 [Candidatus Aminicenantes bacterium RBG_13_62_12]|nr:MAG: hypothetical protein A2Y86_06990 [Candidatus Aminicenantes bacterium RBG_13_62_12]
MQSRRKLTALFAVLFLFMSLSWAGQQTAAQQTREQALLRAFHGIQSATLYEHVREMTSDKYGGRLTGTEEYNLCARWAAELLGKWGVRPAGHSGTFFQAFPNPYTLVFPGCELVLEIPWKSGVIRKSYKYEDEFIPGGTSASGEVRAEVVYVGYGVSAPELGYDDYGGVDVKGKVVLMEAEVPVRPDRDPELFLKWRPHSFHQKKLETAHAKGARGMIYNYGPIGNPNNSYREGFIYSHVGTAVVEDVFAGTGKTHKDVVALIAKTLKPQSFATGKVVYLKNNTEHHPDGTGFNVVGLLPGSDPELEEEVIMLGGHLDHLGRLWELNPGANDNASAVAVLLGVAEAMNRSEVKPRRPVMFVLFGAEEQGVAGSKYFTENPPLPLNDIAAFVNLDGVGVGESINALAGGNFPEFMTYFEKANSAYVHRPLTGPSFANLARPRLDAAWFLWKGVPTLSFSTSGGRSFYHVTKDDLSTINPEILEDTARLLFMAVMDMAAADKLGFRPTVH